MSKLDDKVTVHSIGEERSVGLFNYEIGIRGKKTLETASRKMILNRANELLTKSSSSFRNMRPQAKEIKELKVKWNENIGKIAG